MKVSEIQSHSVSHQITVPFLVHWSEDDIIATATDKGIQIMELFYNPNNKTTAIGCNRYHVDVNESKPTGNVGINTSNLFMKADTNEAFNLLLNQDLAPQIEKATTLQSIVKQIEWSSSTGVLCSGRCVLAYLTNAGQLSFIGYNYKNWDEVFNLSDVWLECCKQFWNSISMSIKHQLSELTYRVGRIKFTAFTWGKLSSVCDDDSNNNNTSLLMVASQDGIISIWKIRNEAQNKENTIQHNINETNISALVLCSVNSKLFYVTALYWHEINSNLGYLIVGNNKGLINIIQIMKNDKNALVSVVDEVWLIEDRILIGKIICWNFDKGFFCIAVKGSFIVIACINSDTGKLLSVFYHNTKMRFITGVKDVEENTILISSRNSCFNLIKLQFNGINIVIEETRIECGFVKNRYALHGFSLSKNKVMGVAVLSVSSGYDHNILREPSSMLLFSLSEINEPLKLLLFKPERVDHIWDCFEVVRWQILNKVITYTLPANLQSVLDTMELKQLIITMWLTKFLAISAENDETEEGEGDDGNINKDKSNSLMSTFEEIEELVFSSNIFKRCATLITNFTILSPFDKESLALMRNWLDHLILSLPESHITTRSSASTLLEEINDYITTNSITLPEFEKCCICQNQVPCLTGFKTSHCLKGHKVNRCSLSLVQCSFERIYRCERCGAIAHQNAITEEDNSCIFCDGILKMDNRLLDLSEIKEEINLPNTDETE
ncbi:uncharacterized protein LOC142334089 isoform X1 [Lycorma delicatula]|uniref:uncharacterized protein LOC142334089 isoform X1 n=1 Tax=Lycorma delicatula TaxID=130591 RepID=UPI003F50FBF9